MIAKFYLKPGKEESLGRFHPWVFSGAIASCDSNPEEGDVVDVYSSKKVFLGRGHCQIGSIAIRILTFVDEQIDRGWWYARLASAAAMRASIGLPASGVTDSYRLVHGEGDGLPGLIIDVYGAVAVIQCHSVGMYLSREVIADCLIELFGGRLTAVYDKSSGTVPFNAGLEAADGYLHGKGGPSEILENGNKFLIDWERGQKTGFFLDQRDNRELVARYSRGRKVLNTFSYTGGFSVYAFSGGALGVDSVDSSEHAVSLAEKNVRLNFGDQANHRAIKADATEFLKDPGEYDMIILDPPAFAKHRGAIPNALQGYKRLNARAISALEAGGLLFTFSCSQAIVREQFRTTIFSAAASTGRRVRILHQLTQPADHPVSIYHPEGEYLKGLVLEVE